MILDRLRRSLLPLPLLARGYDRFFRHIRVDEAWEAAVRGAAGRGRLVFVLRNVSLLDLLALDYLTRKLGLPIIGFASELGQWIVAPEGARPDAAPSEALRATLAAGGSAVLFMKRAPSVIERTGAAHRGRSDGDDLLIALIDEQRRDPSREIILMPQTFVWTQRPERLGFSLVDTVFGPADFPGDMRAAAQFLLNYKNCVLRAGDAASLAEFLGRGDAQGQGADALVRRLTYALLRKVERERRAILGPAEKPADRVREEVLRSPKLQAILRDMAGPSDAAREALTEKARGMLRELEAAPDAQTLKGLELAADTLVERVYAGVDVDAEGLARVREAAKQGSLVILPSHRSHVDYVLLTYVFRKNALQIPVVAAGDNLAFFPIGPIFRRAGAFFIRRNFKGDRLYTSVVDAYIRRLIKGGYAIEFFLEGGRSRTGKLLSPKLGLLNMVVDAAISLEQRTVSFVPVSIGYERMMEEGAFARELSGGTKRKEDAAALLGLTEVLREKYGRANVQFGEPITLAEMAAKVGITSHPVSPAKRRAVVTRLAHKVMSEINRVTAVTPGSLVAMVMLCHGGRGIPHAALVGQCARLTELVRALGARTTPSLTRGPAGTMREAAIRDAAQLYVRGGIVRQHVPGDTLTGKARRRARIYSGDDVIYTVPDDKRLYLDLAKNSIVHLFVDRALVSVGLLSPPGPPLRQAELRERVLSLSRLFKLEFMFRDRSFDQNFEDILAEMARLGELEIAGDLVRPGPGHAGLDGAGWIAFYASVVKNFVESYLVAARAVRVLSRGPLPEKELVTRALRIGEQMFLGAEIERSEAVSGPVIENALLAFVDQGYLRKSADKLALAESFGSEEGAQAVEARISSYLSAKP
jgi:glycerol-3-phosphate O-acyltransferase